MSISGASAASSYALSQQLPSITQHKRGRPSLISDVDPEGANAAGASSPASPRGKAAHKVDITA